MRCTLAPAQTAKIQELREELAAAEARAARLEESLAAGFAERSSMAEQLAAAEGARMAVAAEKERTADQLSQACVDRPLDENTRHLHGARHEVVVAGVWVFGLSIRFCIISKCYCRVQIL